MISGSLALLDMFLLGSDFEMLMTNVEAQTVVNAHVLIGDPNEREQRNEISTPSAVEHLKTCHHKKECGDIMAQAILASDDEEQFATNEAACGLRLTLAVLPRLAEYLFVRDSPRDASDWYREDKQPRKLMR